MEVSSREFAMQRNLELVRCYRIMIVGMAVPVTGLVPLWKSAGLSSLEINALQALFAVTLFLWEVPSGYWADRTTRRGVLLWGSATLFVGSIAYAMAENFNQFLSAEILIGIGFAFISGADEALLFDSLNELGRAKEFEKSWGRIRAFELIAGALAVAFGGIVCSYSVRAALWISVVYFAAQLFIAYRLVETSREKPGSDGSHVRQVVAVARHCLVQEKNLRWLFMYSSAFFALLQPVVWWYQPYLVDGCGVSTTELGFIWASFGITAAYFAQNAQRITARFSPIVAFGSVLGVTAMSYLLLGVWQGAWSFLFILLHQASRGYS